jgi:tetratricopeptide (TPR) repeat protein
LAEPDSKGRILRAQARSRASRGEVDEALQTYVEAVNIFRASNQHNEVAFTLAEVAETLHLLAKDKHAAVFFEQALAAAAKTADPAFLAPILRDASLFFKKHGETDRAFEMMRDAFELFEILRDEWAQAQIAHELGRILEAKGQPDEALEWLRRALPLTPEERDADLRMRIYYDMGRVFLSKDLKDRAVSCFNNSALLAKRIFDADCLGASLEALGDIAFAQMNTANAKRYFKEAYAMNEGLLTARKPGETADDDQVYEVRKDVLVGKLISAYLADPNTSVSEKEIAEFLAHLHKRRDVPGLAAALSKIADYFRTRGEHARAARFFENAAGIFERAGMTAVSAQIDELLGDLYRDRGLPRKAFNRYWKSANLLESSGGENAALRRRLQEAMEALKPSLALAASEGDEGAESAARGPPA